MKRQAKEVYGFVPAHQLRRDGWQMAALGARAILCVALIVAVGVLTWPR